MMVEPPRRRPLGFEVALVTLLAFAVLAPGIWSYTLVDPWETHYGEVSRRMLQDHDLVHTTWEDEGFRSKPVLTFWVEAISMRALGVARDGGYSGELEHDGPRTMLAIRLPFVLFGVLGLVLMWWMLARLVNRRLAWLALLVVGSCPMYCMIARQAIPDMLLTTCMTGALAMFLMAVEDGERPIERLARLGRRTLDARHLLWLVAGGIVVAQAAYYAYYFTVAPELANHIRAPGVAIFLPALMLLALVAMWSPAWNAIGRPFRRAHVPEPIRKLLALAPITTMRQVFLLWCYTLLGVSILAKGPPALGVVGILGLFYVVLLGRWRQLYDGAFELKRGVILMIVIFLPWHFAMYLKDGVQFIDEYLFSHLLNRAGDGSVDKSFGTFEHYILQLGYGMWIWAAILPPAIAWLFLRTRTDTRDGRVRFVVALWAILTVAFFSIVQTKFHHYILPAVPALGIAVAFFLDDKLAGRVRLHPLLAGVGVALVLFICADLMSEPGRWIDMFMFGYNRPWPSGEPWHIDPSDGFLVLGVLAAIAVALLGTRFSRIAVAASASVGLAICVWSLQAYMPSIARHWGTGETIRSYYAKRTIYGENLIYFGSGELYDAWHGHDDRWRFESFIPDTLQVGQPMTLHVEVHRADNDKMTESTDDLHGIVTAIGDHDVELVLAPGERKKLDARMADGEYGKRGRPPVLAVDADRLFAWQLYWRGEAFWSGDEIWGWLPSMQTSGPINVKTDNVDFLKYLNDRTKAPLGRRYFVVTVAEHASSLKSVLPTPRARDTVESIDISSNKYTLLAFWL